MWKKAMVALGLQDDEDDTDFMGFDSFEDDNQQSYNSQQTPTVRTHQRATSPREQSRPTRPTALPTRMQNETPSVRTIAAQEPVRPQTIRTMPMTTATSASVHVCEPKSFNDAQEIGERLKMGRPVIMNLSSLPRELQRRLIDFASGLAFALDGSMSRVDDHVFLLAPENVDVSEEEKQRIANSGLY